MDVTVSAAASLAAAAFAIANIQAVSARYGAAPLAFLLVPVVGAFLIDVANALVISLFVNVMPVLRRSMQAQT